MLAVPGADASQEATQRVDAQHTLEIFLVQPTQILCSEYVNSFVEKAEKAPFT